MDSPSSIEVSLDGQDILDMTEVQDPGPLSTPTTTTTIKKTSSTNFLLMPKSIEALIDSTPLGVSDTDIDRYNSRYILKEQSASTTWIPAHMNCQESQISAWYLKPKPSVSRNRKIIKEWDFYGNPIFEQDQQQQQLPVAFSCTSTNPPPQPPRHDPNQQSRRDSPPSSIFVDSSKEECCSGCSDFLDDPKTSFDDTNPSCVGEFFNCIKINIKDLSLFCRDDAWTNRYDDAMNGGKSITEEREVVEEVVSTNEESNACQPPLVSQGVNVKDLLLEFSLRNELADLQRKEKEIEKLYQHRLLAQLEAVALTKACDVVRQRTM
jgi:hypothetical protein